MEDGLVCGIDLGGQTTLSYVAWLSGHSLVLDAYQAAPRRPLPPPPAHRAVAAYAIDGPQGLPRRVPGGARSCRAADRAARTPTMSLPTTRAGLGTLRLYGALVRLSVDLFWTAVCEEGARLYGLDASAGDGAAPLLCETWPRLVLRAALAPGARIPSKRRAPEAYVRAAWGAVESAGLRAAGVRLPSVDQADAALCAIAARAVLAADRPAAAGLLCLGSAPALDREERVVREGFIVAPARPAPQGTAMASRNMA